MSVAKRASNDWSVTHLNNDNDEDKNPVTLHVVCGKSRSLYSEDWISYESSVVTAQVPNKYKKI